MFCVTPGASTPDFTRTSTVPAPAGTCTVSRLSLRIVTFVPGVDPNSTDGTNAARDATVTFDRAGAYLFQVTIADAAGLTVTSSVAVSVAQTLTRIALTPSSATVVLGGQVRFAALALDQFGVALEAQPAFSWTVASGPGAIDPTGLYTVSGKKTGTALIRVSAGGVTATATVKVVRR